MSPVSVRRPSTISKIFSSETALPATFYMKGTSRQRSMGEGGTNVYTNYPCHMTKMAAMPIYGKPLQNLLLRNELTDFNETWHEVSMTHVLRGIYES